MSPDGKELVDLVRGLLGRGRYTLGLCAAPGAGKSALSAALTTLLGDRAAYVPMDGFHLADHELVRRDLLHLKGAPETFDAWGYAALLRRLRERPSHTVYAPGFERDLEQPIAGAIAVEPDVDVVLTEGNYLLLDRPEWQAVRGQLDEVWFLATDHRMRISRLVARHVRFGKSPEEARAWVARVDEANARLVEESADRADRVLDLTAWQAPAVGLAERAVDT